MAKSMESLSQKQNVIGNQPENTSLINDKDWYLNKVIINLTCCF